MPAHVLECSVFELMICQILLTCTDVQSVVAVFHQTLISQCFICVELVTMAEFSPQAYSAGVQNVFYLPGQMFVEVAEF